MYVGNNKNDIQLSNNIYEDEISKILLFSNNKEKVLNNYVLPNLIKNKKFIYIDYNKELCQKDLGKNVKILDLNNFIDYNYDPFYNIQKQSEVENIIYFILHSFNFKTTTSKECLKKGLISFIKAIIYFEYTYSVNPSFQNIYNLLNRTNSISSQNNLDQIFEEKITSSIILNDSLKEYFKFKLLPIKIQNEVITQCKTVFKILSNLKINKFNSINIDEFLENDESLIIIPDNESCIKLVDLFLYQLLKKIKYKFESEYIKSISLSFKNLISFNDYNINCKNTKIHLLMNPGEHKHNQLIINLLSDNTLPITSSLIINDIKRGYNTFGKKFINYLTQTNIILLIDENDKVTLNYINNNFLLQQIDNEEVLIIKKNLLNKTFECIIDNLIYSISIAQLKENKYFTLKNNIKNVLTTKHKKNKNWNFEKEKHNVN